MFLWNFLWTSKIWNELKYYNLPRSQIKRLQNIHNSLARAVTRMPKSFHITPVVKSLHWLKINERIKYKLISLTYKVLTTNQPQYSTIWFLFNLVTTHVLYLWSLLLAHLPGPLWKSLIDVFGMLHLVCETNSPLSGAACGSQSCLLAAWVIVTYQQN